MLGLPEGIRACLFDLDGVLTDTASVHTRAWKAMFDEFLLPGGHAPFTDADYRAHVDGRPRLDGIRAFLASRGIDLPDGAPDDQPGTPTVHGLANRKNDLFHEQMRRDGVTVFPGTRPYLRAVSDAGLAVAVVSASANTRDVLEAAGLTEFVDCRVDGVTIRTEGLAGKPAPDSFLRAAELLAVKPAQAAVFEDALAGVQAGRAGGFGIVVGVDRIGDPESLRRNGADVVVSDLGDLLAAP